MVLVKEFKKNVKVSGNYLKKGNVIRMQKGMKRKREMVR